MNELTFSFNLQPVYAPSAISARGGKFRFLPGTPGYVTVSRSGSVELGPPLSSHTFSQLPSKIHGLSLSNIKKLWSTLKRLDLMMSKVGCFMVVDSES
jgi:hypothetical protein